MPRSLPLLPGSRQHRIVDPAHSRPSLRRKLLMPLAIFGALLAAAVLLSARHEMRTQLETQLLNHARLVVDAARRIPHTTSPSSSTPDRNSHGASLCHRCMGIWNTANAVTTLTTRNRACRTRKYAGLPEVNLLDSASAMDAE